MILTKLLIAFGLGAGISFWAITLSEPKTLIQIEYLEPPGFWAPIFKPKEEWEAYYGCRPTWGMGLCTEKGKV